MSLPPDGRTLDARGDARDDAHDDERPDRERGREWESYTIAPQGWLPRWFRRPWWWLLGALVVALLVWAATQGHVFFLFLFLPLGFGLFRAPRRER